MQSDLSIKIASYGAQQPSPNSAREYKCSCQYIFITLVTYLPYYIEPNSWNFSFVELVLKAMDYFYFHVKRSVGNIFPLLIFFLDATEGPLVDY